jgi:hypothetical protein
LPPLESEGPEAAVIDDEGRAVVVGNHGAGRESGQRSLPCLPVLGSDKSPTGLEAFGGEPLIDLFGAGRLGQAFDRGNCPSVPVEVLSPAEGARAVAGGEGNGLVEKEERGPGAGLGERMFPILELEPAGDPGVELMMANDLPFVVDQTATVSGEGPSGRDGVEIAPRVDSVAPRHS